MIIGHDEKNKLETLQFGKDFFLEMKNYESGSGLDIKALQKLKEILDNFKKGINILEFGSGMSTKFLIDYKLKTNKNISIDSFDHDEKYSYKNKTKYDFLNLYICPLITCSTENFNKQISEKKFNPNVFKKHSFKEGDNIWRPRNCFYDIKKDMLKDYYDLVIVDGPNGNGRNLAYLNIIDKVKKGTIIFMDDYDSSDGDFNYDFVKNINYMLDVKEIYSLTSEVGFYKGGKFKIFEVL